MKKDFDTMIAGEAIRLEKLKVDKEFQRETAVAFDFDDPVETEVEEEGSLERLEKMLLGQCTVDAEPLERMEKLVDLFKDRQFEPVQSTLHYVLGGVMGAGFRCGKLPDGPLSVDEVPGLFTEEIARITGILVAPDEVEILWNSRAAKHVEEYATLRDYFLDDGMLGWKYVPKTRIPGERWRISITQTSHEISAVFQRIKMFREGCLTVEDRLTSWGIVMYTASKIQTFKCDYSARPEEWQHILLILEICEKDLEVVEEFTGIMDTLDLIQDLIPIRVLEVITVFRVLFRLSIEEFELAYKAFE